MLNDFIDLIANFGKLIDGYYEKIGSISNYGFLWFLVEITNDSDEACQAVFDYVNISEIIMKMLSSK